MSFLYHLGVFASGFGASRRFHGAALQPLGVTVGYQPERVAEYWHAERDTPSWSLERPDDPAAVTRSTHIAFTADGRAAVDAFHAAAVASGGTSRHTPRHRPEYRAYCAFVSDPDGKRALDEVGVPYR